MLLSQTFALLLGTASVASAKWIVPGARWLDTDGNIFNAHAGGLCVDEKTGRFCWFGEYKIQGQVEGGGISVYSSDDLATWESHGLALEGHEYVSSHNRIQRPKVIYSKETGKYHMWWHVVDSKYSMLLQGLATADSIAGPYIFQDAIAPLGNWVEGRDVYVSKFNSNLTDVEEVTFRFNKYDFEAPTILQTEKSYFALMSHKTGYRPNNVVGMRADKLEGPWSQPFIVSPAYTRTFRTQSGFSWRIKGSKKTTYLYMADQWDMLQTGEWYPIKGKTYTSKRAKLAGDAFLQEASFGSHNVIATGIYGNDSMITFEVDGQGQDRWVSFYHQNTDDMGFGDQPYGQPDRINGTWQLRRISSVVLNDDTDHVHTLYQKDTHKGIILSTPLQLPLKKGRNKITIGGLYNGFDYKGADLDRIVVYPPEPKNRKRAWF
ncbi:hypothetical protein ACHAP0_001851 [Verticillium nonalfalfae]